VRQLEELLEAAGSRSASVEARVLFAAIDGAAQHYALDPERYPLEQVAGALERRFAPTAAGPRNRKKRERQS
jgi:hypothetical protein